ncbi:MAG: DinB family protein [Chitinophagales bacterium]|nr:DinB family protein [Chitinophagales bacterium]
MTDQQTLFVKMAYDAWQTYIQRASDLFAKLTDDQLMEEIAPGRNRGIYMLGHLTAVHDRLLPMLGLGERVYSQLDDTFIANPDKSGLEFPPITQLRQSWSDVNSRLKNAFNKMTPAEWLERHMSVSQEDFNKEPHRNKLNVLINRTNHLAYHLGQLKLMDK